jgi:hypothetical protein
MSVFPSQTNFVTGDILTATAVNEIGQAINLLDGAQEASGKNRIINGAMDFFQRGTSFAGSTLGAYCADRWGYYRGGAVGGATWTRQTASLTGFQYSLRAQRDSGNTSTQYVGTWQTIETANSLPLAGKTVTLSFYAKCGANYSAASNALAVTVITGTGTDQAVYSFTGSTNAVTGTATLTTSWQRFTYTGALSSALTEVGVQFISTPTGTAGANDWYEITGVQLEAANTASNFQRAAGNIGGELALCQRYYVRFTETSSSSDWMIGFGTGFSTTGATIQVKHPVTMRVYPSSVDFSLLAIQDGTNSRIAVTNLTLSERSKDLTNVNVTVASGATQYRPYFLSQNSNATGYLGFNAEL